MNNRVRKHTAQYLTRKRWEHNRLCNLKLLLKATNMTWSFWQLWQIRFHLPESQPCSFNCNYWHIMIPTPENAPSQPAKQSILYRSPCFNCSSVTTPSLQHQPFANTPQQLLQVFTVVPQLFFNQRSSKIWIRCFRPRTQLLVCLAAE